METLSEACDMVSIHNHRRLVLSTFFLAFEIESNESIVVSLYKEKKVLMLLIVRLRCNDLQAIYKQSVNDITS